MMAEAMRIPKQLNPTKVRCPPQTRMPLWRYAQPQRMPACIGACVRTFRGMGSRTVVAGK
jgi:hypothetical protein